MCGTTSKGITRLLPITGTSTLPMGTALYLPLARRRPARKVGDPDHREDHVEHYHGYHQETYNDYVGPPAHAVRRLFVQPRDREQPDNEQGRDDHIRDGDERRAGEEDQPLIQEEEEPLGTRHIDRSADLRRLRKGGRNPVGEDYNHHQNNRRDGEICDNLSREEPLGLVVAVEDVLSVIISSSSKCWFSASCWSPLTSTISYSPPVARFSSSSSSRYSRICLRLRSFASLSEYSKAAPNSPCLRSRYRWRAIRGASAAGNSHTWMANTRERVAGPAVSPPSRNVTIQSPISGV